MKPTIEAKIVVLGAQGAGKTSLVLRHMNKSQFSSAVSPTIGASFFTSRMTVDVDRVKLQLWDTAGQERFRSMAPMYYRNANAALIVYDITAADTFEAVASWVAELRQNVDYKMVLCLIGNKVDLEDRRVVTKRAGQEYANSIDASFFETSALGNICVHEAFLQVALDLIECERRAHPERFVPGAAGAGDESETDSRRGSNADGGALALAGGAGRDETDGESGESKCC
ncbi:uncharacterized protein LOC135818199 [Sycon ciliatum]|uniref:uncharacterized protein LOC135818199 n=1 Tax=Sycon ciliatum TaxID=27933 RepID=UPI0020AAE0E7|eukprot:scpid65985/ scgid24388/ Ras-related protein RHN1